jgi:hypothetical protein
VHKQINLSSDFARTRTYPRIHISGTSDPLPVIRACLCLWKMSSCTALQENISNVQALDWVLCLPSSCEGFHACPIFEVESNDFVEWGTDGAGPTCVCSPVSRAPQVQPSPSDCKGWGGTSSPPPSSPFQPSSKLSTPELYAVRPPQFGDATFPIPIEPFAAALQLSLVEFE